MNYAMWKCRFRLVCQHNQVILGSKEPNGLPFPNESSNLVLKRNFRVIVHPSWICMQGYQDTAYIYLDITSFSIYTNKLLQVNNKKKQHSSSQWKKVQNYNAGVQKSYRGLDKLISVGASTDNHGDSHRLGSSNLARGTPFGLLGKERWLEESSRCHCFWFWRQTRRSSTTRSLIHSLSFGAEK